MGMAIAAAAAGHVPVCFCTSKSEEKRQRRQRLVGSAERPTQCITRQLACLFGEGPGKRQAGMTRREGSAAPQRPSQLPLQQMSGAREERNATAARKRHRSLVPAPEVNTDTDGDDYDDERARPNMMWRGPPSGSQEWNPDPLSPAMATEYINLNSGER